MANTSTIHIKTDFDCIVYDYGQEIGTTKAETFFNVELRRGEHVLSFVYLEDDCISKNITYKVVDIDNDYCLIIKIVEEIIKKAVEYYDDAMKYYAGPSNIENPDYYFSKAFHLLTVAAKLGNAEAQYHIGDCYEYGHGVDRDLAKAEEWYTKAAEQGYVDAQYHLAEFWYDEGFYAEKDLVKAVKWYTKAAEQGHAGAQCNLGWCYEYGKGVGKDLTKAVEWYTKAAEQGNEYAQFRLGGCYEAGIGVEGNLVKAFEWYTKAAEQGHVDAQYNLGFYYKLGFGVVRPDLTKAVVWYAKAAEQGLAKAQCSLGYCYEKGLGVKKDIIKAVECYTKAAKQKDEYAIKALDRLKQKTKHITRPIKYLFLDTETTGIPKDYNAPTSDSKNWPRLVQLSWITTDEECNILSQNDFIIYPDGFTIPEEAVRLHGITTDIAKEKGTPLKEAIDKFMEDFNTAKAIVGHNIAFDKKIIGAELIRLGQKDIMNSKQSLCTMEASTDYCKIPGYHGYKYPKLQELHKKLFGYEFEDAHNSMSDVTATLKCFKEMRKRGLI